MRDITGVPNHLRGLNGIRMSGRITNTRVMIVWVMITRSMRSRSRLNAIVRHGLFVYCGLMLCTIQRILDLNEWFLVPCCLAHVEIINGPSTQDVDIIKNFHLHEIVQICIAKEGKAQIASLPEQVELCRKLSIRLRILR